MWLFKPPIQTSVEAAVVPAAAPAALALSRARRASRYWREKAARTFKKAFLIIFSYQVAEQLKNWLAVLLFYSGVALAARLFARKGAAILIYHSVARKNVFWDNALDPAIFERQVAYLARHYEIVPLSAVLERLRAGWEVPSRWVALTFDDGYRDNLHTVLPILKKYGAQATFFPALNVVNGDKGFFYDSIQSIVENAKVKEVVVELHGHPVKFKLTDPRLKREAILRMTLGIRRRRFEERMAFVERLGRLCGLDGAAAGQEPIYLTKEDVADLHRAGMEVGSHTFSHADLTSLREEELAEEVAGSRTHLQAMIGAPVAGFSYPFGKRENYDDRIKELVKQAGYGYAITTVYGKVDRGCDPYALPRMGTTNGPLARLKVNLMGIPL